MNDTTKTKIFISYSRRDLIGFVEQLVVSLELLGYETLIDRDGISGGEDWRNRLKGLITECDTVVFCLSPGSLESDMCHWEVEETDRLGKRLLPVAALPFDGSRVPERLRELNYIFFYEEQSSPGSGFGTGLAKLDEALKTDLDWVRAHTRYVQRTKEWLAGGKAMNRLLSGNDIQDAKQWMLSRKPDAPEIWEETRDFILTSERVAIDRQSKERKRYEEMEAAQRDRVKALAETEVARKRELEASHKAERRTKMGLFAVLALFLVTVAFGLFALKEQQQENERLLRESADAQAESLLQSYKLARARDILPWELHARLQKQKRDVQRKLIELVLIDSNILALPGLSAEIGKILKNNPDISNLVIEAWIPKHCDSTSISLLRMLACVKFGSLVKQLEPDRILSYLSIVQTQSDGDLELATIAFIQTVDGYIGDFEFREEDLERLALWEPLFGDFTEMDEYLVHELCEIAVNNPESMQGRFISGLSSKLSSLKPTEESRLQYWGNVIEALPSLTLDDALLISRATDHLRHGDREFGLSFSVWSIWKNHSGKMEEKHLATALKDFSYELRASHSSDSEELANEGVQFFGEQDKAAVEKLITPIITEIVEEELKDGDAWVGDNTKALIAVLRQLNSNVTPEESQRIADALLATLQDVETSEYDYGDLAKAMVALKPLPDADTLFASALAVAKIFPRDSVDTFFSTPDNIAPLLPHLTPEQSRSLAELFFDSGLSTMNNLSAEDYSKMGVEQNVHKLWSRIQKLLGQLDSEFLDLRRVEIHGHEITLLDKIFRLDSNKKRPPSWGGDLAIRKLSEWGELTNVDRAALMSLIFDSIGRYSFESDKEELLHALQKIPLNTTQAESALRLVYRKRFRSDAGGADIQMSLLSFIAGLVFDRSPQKLSEILDDIYEKALSLSVIKHGKTASFVAFAKWKKGNTRQDIVNRFNELKESRATTVDATSLVALMAQVPGRIEEDSLALLDEAVRSEIRDAPQWEIRGWQSLLNTDLPPHLLRCIREEVEKIESKE